MKKLLSLLLAGLLVLPMSSCGNKAKYTVGICQIQPHVALDAATDGFKQALKDELGDDVAFKEEDAGGDISLCTTITNGFASSNVDLILANGTPALQAAVNATSTIPILGTSITEYGSALGIKDFDGVVGRNISGTSDLAPLSEQAAMFNELIPDKNTIGLIYCSSESNSKYQVDTIKAELEKLGKTCELYPFADTNDMMSVCSTAVSKCDAIYVPTDNTVATYMSILDNVARPAKVPVITGEEGMCAGGGIATLSISYYDLGYTTGKMAAKILKGEADISEMKIEYAPEPTKKYNKAICDELGITIPEGYTAIESTAK